MAFQRTEALTEIAFVSLQRVHQRGVTARDPPVRPLVVSRQPSQQVFLKLREADSRHPLRCSSSCSTRGPPLACGVRACGAMFPWRYQVKEHSWLPGKVEALAILGVASCELGAQTPAQPRWSAAVADSPLRPRPTACPAVPIGAPSVGCGFCVEHETGTGGHRCAGPTNASPPHRDMPRRRYHW